MFEKLTTIAIRGVTGILLAVDGDGSNIAVTRDEGSISEKGEDYGQKEKHRVKETIWSRTQGQGRNGTTRLTG